MPRGAAARYLVRTDFFEFSKRDSPDSHFRFRFQQGRLAQSLMTKVAPVCMSFMQRSSNVHVNCGAPW